MQVDIGLPVQLADLADRLGGLLGIAEQQHGIGASGLQLDDLGIDARIDRGKTLGGDDCGGLGAEAVVEAGQQFLAEIVILMSTPIFGSALTARICLPKKLPSERSVG